MAPFCIQVTNPISLSEANRQKFADNLVDFMQHYGFDGVDVDWEYPGTGDQRGTYGLTFTIPLTYWYLQWFDVPSMLEYADWVNLMSYDLYGVWDQDNPIGSIVLDNAGTLAYFEIQDILTTKKPKVIYDKEAAVNYLFFKGDQWVDFDDKETFKQKINWVNDIGLGGVMIWSVGQDDNQFSALEGLLGYSVGDYESMMARLVITDTEHWASSSG
ncbi:glycoside hydrolase superfamily [Aspergillus alliaceus]|uniref:chitinase n=1 Tax=Petromyces alliaceus TaxID=209559 RepID=A0A5N7CN19_PETAA|nr:glycoside hydrolase superfamily [Aspergillus alliaceus]